MRPIERIDNFLNKVDWNKLCKRWDIDRNIFEDEVFGIYELKNNPFVVYWKENPDQCIGQVLINLNLISDKMDIWLDEESDILDAQGLLDRNCVHYQP